MQDKASAKYYNVAMEMKKIATLKAVDDVRAGVTLERHSSIDQYNDVPIKVIKGGVVTPLSFDVIDYVGCDCIKWHEAAMMPGDWIGYNFPVSICHWVSDVYVVGDENQQVMRRIPEWTGMEGFVEEYILRPHLTQFDNASLGQRNAQDLKIGRDYVLASTTLPAVE